MDIPLQEYEQPRTIFEMCDWINSKLRALEQFADFEERYFERRGPHIKKLLEEAVPIAHLGLYFWRPWRDVTAICLTGNQAYDATITLQDPHQSKTIRIEVTCTETDESTMRRQALSRDGSVPMTGSVWREGRRIMSEPAMVDLDVERTHLMETAFARFQTKSEQETDPQTAILIYVSTPRSLPLWYRAQLMEKTRIYLRTKSPILYGKVDPIVKTAKWAWLRWGQPFSEQGTGYIYSSS
jgi:hypothetical protein